MKCERCSKDIEPASAVILDFSLCSRQYQSGEPGPIRRSSAVLCSQCASDIVGSMETLQNSIQALIVGRDLPGVAAMKERIEQLRRERDDAQAQFDMYGGDEGITAMLEELETLREQRALAPDE